MPSEHRLHVSSVLFGLAAQARNLAVPGILVLFGASRAGADWEPWLMLFLIPYTVFAVVRYLSFRYRYEPHQIVVRSGLLFRNERHVPYARIQNLDAVQNVAHRLLGVVEVRVQTGAGTEPEVVLSVVPTAALDEMRRRVFGVAGRAPGAEEMAAPPRTPLLHLSLRELLLCGFIENRGVVLIAAGFGVLWEAGFADPIFERIFGEDATGRGVIRGLFSQIFGGTGISGRQAAITLAVFLGLFLLIRLLSMVWAAIRLYGFRLTRDGDDLRLEFGLLTRVTATIPLRRIQTLTIYQGPLQALVGRLAVRVETAGGHGSDHGDGGKTSEADRAWLAPIIRPAALHALLHDVLPEVDLEAVAWQSVHPRAFSRAFKRSLLFWIPIALTPVLLLEWWTPLLVAAVVVWARIDARQYVRHIGFATTESVVAFKTGWIWKRTTVARVAKIQVVTLSESPFDRRSGMAGVIVDTAGGGGDKVDIPFLARETADALHSSLAVAAAQTEFRW